MQWVLKKYEKKLSRPIWRLIIISLFQFIFPPTFKYSTRLSNRARDLQKWPVHKTHRFIKPTSSDEISDDNSPKNTFLNFENISRFALSRRQKANNKYTVAVCAGLIISCVETPLRTPERMYMCHVYMYTRNLERRRVANVETNHHNPLRVSRRFDKHKRASRRVQANAAGGRNSPNDR